MSASNWNLKHLLLVCAAIYVLTAGGHFGSTDEEDLYRNTALLSSLFQPSDETARYLSESGIGAARQEVGQSLLAIPWYWASQIVAGRLHPRWHVFAARAIMTTFNLVVTLITIAVLFCWARKLASRQDALIVAGLYGLTTLAWPYSQTFYREPLVGLCLLLAFWYGSRFRRSQQRHELLVALAALIMAIATKTTALIAVPWFLVISLPPGRLRGDKLLKGLSIILLLTAVVAFVLPSKMTTLVAYLHEIEQDIRFFLPEMARYGLHGLLTSPGKGLFVTAPTVLLGIIGLGLMWRLHGRETLAISGLFLTFVVIYSTRRGWHGGASWGPRYLLPVLPLLMLPSAVLLTHVREANGPPVRLARYGMALLVLLGLTAQVSAATIFHQNFYELKYQEGVIGTSSLDGGRTYMQELFFDPAHSPVWGQAQLLQERSLALLQGASGAMPRPLPALPEELWHYFIAQETLDFWWLYLARMDHGAALSVTNPSVILPMVTE